MSGTGAHDPRSNLKRGGLTAEQRRAGTARSIEVRAEERERQQGYETSEPVDVIMSLFRSSAAVADEAFRRVLKTGKGYDDRRLVEIAREARLASDRAFEILQLQGALAEADQFFTTLSDRVELLAPGLAEDARPIVTAPA